VQLVYVEQYYRSGANHKAWHGVGVIDDQSANRVRVRYIGYTHRGYNNISKLHDTTHAAEIISEPEHVFNNI